MEKYLRGVFIIGLSIILTACTTDQKVEIDDKKEVDKRLVHKLVGSWLADSYDYGHYEIVYEKNRLTFNSTKLEIEYTEENKVFTHKQDDKTVHYIFEAKEDELIVYPSYEIEQSRDELAVGGDLAPIQLKKTRTLSKESILGQWQSIEADYPAFIQIRTSYDVDKVELLLAQTKNADKVETILLTFETGKNELIYLNDDQTMRYSFSYYKESQMIINVFTTKEEATGAARPWVLERVVNQ